MQPAAAFVRRSGDGVDLVCRICGESSRLHPDEPFITQLRIFLSQHRHPS